MTDDTIGIVLSGATTDEAACQLTEDAEESDLREGSLLGIETNRGKILARVGSIIPHNSFYTEGDAWSEARRQGMNIPEDVARQYQVCELDLLTKLPQKPITNPPQPGDEVRWLDPREQEEEIYNESRGNKGILWYGTMRGYEDAPIPLDVEFFPMHMGIFGVTGSGKSFDAGVLIEKLAAIPAEENRSVSYPMIIVDPHGDYIEYADHFGDEGKLGSTGNVTRLVFRDAYVEHRGTQMEPIGLDLNQLSSRELADLIVKYQRGTTEGADLQVNALQEAFEELSYQGIEQHDLLQRNRDQLEHWLDQSDLIHSSTLSAIRRQLNEFENLEDEHQLLSVDSPMKSDNFAEKITDEGQIVILDFSAEGAPGVDLKTKQFVVSYLATILLDQFTEFKVSGEDRYLALLIEEAQNFTPGSSYPIGYDLAGDRISDIATQGRKFGLSLCMISQRPSFVNEIVLSMCNTFLIHRISQEDVGFVHRITGGLPDSMSNRLTTMGTGQLIATGQMLPVSYPLLIDVPPEQRTVEHQTGETDVVGSLFDKRNS